MDGAREQFLADAGFSFDQHRNCRARCLLRGAQHTGHGVVAGNDVGEGQSAFAAMFDALQLALQRAGVERIAQRHLKAFDADRLHDEILGAGAHRRHDVIDAAMSGLNDDGDVEAGFADFCQHAHAIEAGHHQIEHHGIDGRRVGCGEHGDGRVA